MIDRAGPPPIPRPLGQIITQPLKLLKPMIMIKKKWVDDFTVLAAINFKDALVTDTDPVRPVSYHEQTEHILPVENNVLQSELAAISTYSLDRKMILNPLKTKVMIFNSRTKYDCHPLLSIQPDSQLDVVEQHKILGQIVRSDLKTISNTESICKKVYSRMWILRRLKSLGCPEAELIEVIKQQIVSVCEVAVAWWGPMISKHESNMLERTFKCALHSQEQRCGASNSGDSF